MRALVRAASLSRLAPSNGNRTRKDTFAVLPAYQYSFTWNGNERKVVLVEQAEWLYRVIYDPESPINLDIVGTIHFA